MKIINGVSFKTLGYQTYNNMWRDFINNFLTIQDFADYHQIEKRIAVHLLDTGE